MSTTTTRSGITPAGPGSGGLLRPALLVGLGVTLAMVGAAAIYLWVVRGGLMLFDVSAVFCL